MDYKNSDYKNDDDANNDDNSKNIDKDNYREGYKDDDNIDNDKWYKQTNTEIGNLSQSPAMWIPPQEAPNDNNIEGVVVPPINAIDGDTVATNHSMVSKPMVPSRRSERSVAQLAEYLHVQSKKKQVSFSDNAIFKSIKQCHTILGNNSTKTKKYNPVVAPVIACIITDIN